MAESPRVSVVVTCYNYARYLADAVDSAAGQTFGGLEVIIVNDGSTDGSGEVAQGLADRYRGKVKVIDQPNRGAAAARNEGINAAAGEYIVSLDGDDMLKPDFAEKTVRLMDDNPGVSIVYTSMELVGELKEGWPSRITDAEYDFGTLTRRNIIPSCNLFRKKAWEDAGGYKKLIGAEDWELWISMGEKGHAGMLLPEPLYVHRLHGPSKFSITSGRFTEVVAEIQRLHPQLYYPRLHRAGMGLLINMLIALSAARDRASHWLYENNRAVHSFLRSAVTLVTGKARGR